jgi:hypothetical protein
MVLQILWRCLMLLSCSRVFVLLLMSSVLASFGCDEGAAPTGTASPDDHGDHVHAEGEEHAHPTEGPHHGKLVELGNESYHAEVVHDDEAGTLMVYLLDSAAKNAVYSEASEIVINIRKGDQPLQFKLGGLKKDGQPEGKFSEYSLVEPELLKALHDKASTAKLSVTIDGKPYSGDVSHDDHAAHDHAH